MREIKYTLLAEGTSDQALIPILNWLLRQHFEDYEIQSTWADLAGLPKPPKSLSDKVKTSLHLYPCDVLFVHRDTDNQGWEQRDGEIHTAWDAVNEHIRESLSAKLVPVIPVRMTEAWLLLDEAAIRQAADNPRGTVPLDLPTVKTVENLADPKAKLQDLLQRASGASGRRLKQFNRRASDRMIRIANSMVDFKLLRALTAFQRLESQVQALTQQF
ncbi:DUF4276 family protein [Leptolyngbya sp. PCC 6406]|uniref:DUF4276 family protein n=1 Tax=Leptolyngbya sp. PCC 6406 TaxID=1173264 RepID=UPI0002ACDF6E|nr:DUF4276 family protein [Leptolyngbya sp. PCC 6406]